LKRNKLVIEKELAVDCNEIVVNLQVICMQRKKLGYLLKVLYNVKVFLAQAKKS